MEEGEEEGGMVEGEGMWRAGGSGKTEGGGATEEGRRGWWREERVAEGEDGGGEERAWGGGGREEGKKGRAWDFAPTSGEAACYYSIYKILFCGDKIGVCACQPGYSCP